MSWLFVALAGGIVWIGLRGDAGLASFGVGAAVAVVAAWATGMSPRAFISPARLGMGALLVGRLLAGFVLDLTAANARQLRLVLSPGLRVRSRWVRFSTRLEHPATRVVLGVLISLTPGTVTEELRGDEYTVHVLDAEAEEELVAHIRDRFEEPLARLEKL